MFSWFRLRVCDTAQGLGSLGASGSIWASGLWLLGFGPKSKANFRCLFNASVGHNSSDKRSVYTVYTSDPSPIVA